MNRKQIEHTVMIIIKYLIEIRDTTFYKWDPNRENVFVVGMCGDEIHSVKKYVGSSDMVELEPIDIVYDLVYSIKNKNPLHRKDPIDLDYYVLHNHTSGDVTPSDNDYKAANLSKLIFGLLNISLVACAVFDENDYAVIESKEQEYLCGEAEKLICQQ